MVTAYSPHGETGGTLHFPSPSHIRHIDSASTFKQLRRSLSRSPSKGAATFRLVTSKSASPSPSSPLSPSRNCVATRSVSTGYLPNSNATISSPLGTPYCPGVRKTRSNIRRLSPMGVASRSKSSQRSPGRSILSDLSNHGNVTPQSSGEIGDEIENRREQSTSPDGGPAPQLASKPLGAGFKENQIPSRAIARLENSIRIAGASAKSSPLKRSDGIMNLDQANLGSPSAKRRSLHAANLVLDFDIFDHEAASQAFREGRGMISEPTTGDSTSEQLLMVSPLPRRPPSLRRTTLQQRHDKPNLTRSKPHVDLAHDLATPGQSTSKNRFRMSLDNFLPSMPRDSPFSSQGSLPNASAHLMSQPNAKPSTLNWQDRPQRHPLSRTITQSSNSSMAEESPSHIPVRHPEPRKPLVDFSKSLPVGAARPTSREALISNPSSQTAGTEASFSTPENYRLARPLPAAFMSTGLISKRHKDMEDSQAGFQGGRSMMPDTPCKRQSIAVVSNPTVTPDVAAGRASHVRHSFGTPSTPFSPHSSRPAPGVLGKSVSIFGSTFNSGSVNRRGSFLGIEANDHSHSLGKLDSQSSNESDLPPTPTKQITSTSEAWNYSADKSFLHRDVSQPSFGLSADSPDSKSHGTENCKLLSVGTPEVKVDGNSDGNAELSPIAVLGFRNFSALSLSFTRSRSLRDFRTPTPLVQKSNIVQSPHFNDSRTKSSPLSPASSGRERCEQLSPHTPRESMIPPDPSGLSISGHADRHFMGPSDLPSSVSVPPPATPTASRDYSTSFGNGRLSLHVSHDVADVDPSLTSRFEKADLIGTGEFSHVYRVTKFQGFKSLPGCFSLPTARGSSQTPMPVLVWAVKKSRHAFIGPKDRQRKLQEVSTLRALGHSDHTVQFFDSWEERSHLYIQTEFCEEGSLDLFLDRVGRKARLDDFRIWKIMLELSLVRDGSTLILHMC